MLSPINPSVVGYSIVLTSITMAIISSLLALLVGALFFHFEIYPLNLILAYLSILPILIGCAGLGILIAHWLKNFRVIQPVIIVSFVATFFGAGGFAGVAVLPPAARTFANIWVMSYVFEWFNPFLHHFSNSLSVNQWFALLIIGVLGLFIIPLVYQAELTNTTSGGQ